MIPSQHQHKLSVASFSGIKQVDPSFDNVLQEVHGCTDRPTGIVKRMFGKCLNSTTESGPIWSIAQLRFSDRIVNVRRNTSLFQVEPDYDQLPPFVPLDPLAPPVNPSTPATPEPTPPWNPPDWPQNGAKAPQKTFPAPVPRPPRYPLPGMPWDVKIRCVPAYLTIDCTDEPASGSGMLERYQDSSYGGGFWNIQVSWPKTSTWLSMSAGGHGIENGGIYSTTWTDSTHLGDLMSEFSASISGAPDTSTATPVTFTLVVYMGLGTYAPLVNPKGNVISVTCMVNTFKNIYWPGTLTATGVLWVNWGGGAGWQVWRNIVGDHFTTLPDTATEKYRWQYYDPTSTLITYVVTYKSDVGGYKTGDTVMIVGAGGITWYSGKTNKLPTGCPVLTVPTILQPGAPYNVKYEPFSIGPP